MNFNINETAAKMVLIFLLGIAIYNILGRLDFFSNVGWRSFSTAVVAGVLGEVFFNFSIKMRKKK